MLGSTLCTCRHLEWLSSQEQNLSGSRRNSLWFEIVFCFIIPLSSIPIRTSCLAIHDGSLTWSVTTSSGYSLSPYRYLILEGFGCLPAIYPSALSLALTFGPLFVLCLITFIYAGQLAILHPPLYKSDSSTLASCSYRRLQPYPATLYRRSLGPRQICAHRSPGRPSACSVPDHRHLAAHRDLPLALLFPRLCPVPMARMGGGAYLLSACAQPTCGCSADWGRSVGAEAALAVYREYVPHHHRLRVRRGCARGPCQGVELATARAVVSAAAVAFVFVSRTVFFGFPIAELAAAAVRMDRRIITVER